MPNRFFETLGNFFSPRETVHDHWYAPVDNFQFSSAEFYGLIEKELRIRLVPELEMSRVEWSEGGLLSDKRQYLRLKRERLVFDICAAPFGTGYFFSFRFVELPLGVQPLEMLIFVLGVLLCFGILVKIFGVIAGVFVFLLLIAAAIWLLHAAAAGLEDVDAGLLKTPVIGPFYEILFRKETYYRVDTRLMYLTTVNSLTKALADEVTAAKGVKLVKRYERRPISGNLYDERQLSGS